MCAAFLTSVSSLVCLFQPTRRCWAEVEVSPTRSRPRPCLCWRGRLFGLCGADVPLWQPNIFPNSNQRMRDGICEVGWRHRRALQACVCVNVCERRYFPLCSEAACFLLWQVFGSRWHAGPASSSVPRVVLPLRLRVKARTGAKSIVYNLWVRSAVDTNSHFSVYC